MDGDRARELLGLGEDADVHAVKRAFRTLAHDLHPDRGGDPGAFQDVHVAYRQLIARLERPVRPPAPRVARGRPSRAERSTPTRPDVTDATAPLVALTTLERSALTSRRRASTQLDRDALARSLLDGHLLLASRAPGSRFNRFATLLDISTISTLSADPSGIRLTARSRAARRAVTTLDLSTVVGTTWSRRRGDAVTVLSATCSDPRGNHDEGEGDVADVMIHTRDERLRATADAVTVLLDALDWPLRSWQLDTGRA